MAIIFLSSFIVLFPSSLSYGQTIYTGSDGYDYAAISDDNGNSASIAVEAYFLNDTRNQGLVVDLWAYINSSYNGQTEFEIQIYGTGYGYYGIGYTPTNTLYENFNGYILDYAGNNGYIFGCNGQTQNGEVHLMTIISPFYEVPYGALPLNMTVRVNFLYTNTPVSIGYSDMDQNLILGTLQNGVGGGGSCVFSSTPILTANGGYIPAMYISAGMKLMTYNMSTNSFQQKVVEEVTLSYENYSYVINGNLIIAQDQNIMTNEGYINAGNLTYNDTLWNPFSDSYIPIFSIAKVYNPSVMYDFKLSINNNYIGWTYLIEDAITNPCG
ncbi:MAG: hypothetical protein ACP5TO_07655 [Thermoplasmata archaeon]